MRKREIVEYEAFYALFFFINVLSAVFVTKCKYVFKKPEILS